MAIQPCQGRPAGPGDRLVILAAGEALATPRASTRPRTVTGSEYDAILSMLVASFCGANCR